MTVTTKLVEFTDSDTSIFARWYRLVKSLHAPIDRVLVSLASTSAKNPKSTISLVTILSLAVLATGLFTNFNVDVNEDTLWSPIGSRPVSHYDWIEDESGFPDTPRRFLLNIHAGSDNVVEKEGLRKVFDAIDTIRNTPGYDELCMDGGAIKLEDGTSTCRIISATNLWNNSFEIFEADIDSDEDTKVALSQSEYPDGSPVDPMAIMGNPTFDDQGIVTTAAVFLAELQLPRSDLADAFEEVALENIEVLADEWNRDGEHKFRVEYFAERSFSDEFTRAIINDIPLMPAVFTIMSVFTSLVFFRWDKVQSRASLGFGAVCCVFLAIAAGYGLLFIGGVPFTSMTQILPFIMFGIGLDAAFILSGSFYRTDVKKDIVHRIEETVKDVGLSITLTTLTSALAFALGCISSIPAVVWLCLYAFPTIIIDFLFQLTFFIAIMALDEKRVMENRRDCLCCLTATPSSSDEKDAEQEESEGQDTEGDSSSDVPIATESLSDRFMLWYADKLLSNWFVKTIIILLFMGLAGASAYSASLLEQNFDFTEVIPEDSYITPFFDVLNDYTSRGGAVVDVYFRNEDQSSPVIQEQMEDYINSLVDMDQIDNQPSFFWLRDFKAFVEENDELQNATFYEQFDVFYNDPVFSDIYSEEIVVDENGVILESRTKVYMNNIDTEIVTELIAALEDQRDVSSKQQINDGKADWSFFTFSDFYLIWHFYSVAVDELILTTILGVVAVSLLSIIFMPHWSAVFFVAPMISVLYIDLLGFLQIFGIAVNPVSYVALVMSIGLLVDFIVHVLLRYYEVQGDRMTRTTEMLRTMGSSVMLGGISTFLGVLPLAFSTSTIFFTIFVTFLGLVLLGITHGLILLPVLLSIAGPESTKVSVDADITARQEESV